MEGIKKTNKKYSKQFKLSTVEEVLVQGMGLRETARKFGVTHHMVQCWIRKYLDKGLIYFQEKQGDSQNTLTSKRRPSIPRKVEDQLNEDVKRELNRLRMENEYLKKLNALVRKKEKSLPKNTRM